MQRSCGVRKKSGSKELKNAADCERVHSVYQGPEGGRGLGI